MSRAAAVVHLADADTDLDLAIADLSAGDPVYQLIRDIIERLAYTITRCTD